MGVSKTEPYLKVTSRSISVERVLRAVSDRSAGGTVLFIGTVRNSSEGGRVTALELESARDLAEIDLRKIASRAGKRFAVSRVAVVHRIGRLKVGEVIVVVAVSAPHRQAAFLACKYIIDELKKTTPIWKKEFGTRSSRWVEK